MQAVQLADGVNLDDVGVGDAGDRRGFRLKPFQGIGSGCHIRPHDLERDLALQRELLGQVDLPHAALPQPAEDMEIAERFTSEIHFARAEGSVYWLGGSRRCWGGVVHGSRPSWEQSLYCHLVTSRVAVAGE